MSAFAEIKFILPAERVLEEYLGPPHFRRFLCPFHEDHRPSMTTKHGGIVCWACAWRGDVFTFIEQVQGVSRGEALKIAADLAGVVLPDRTRRDKSGRRLRLPSLASSHALVLREIAAIERDVLGQATKAAALAWRRAWGLRQSEEVWDAVEVGAALDREVELLRMEG